MALGKVRITARLGAAAALAAALAAAVAASPRVDVRALASVDAMVEMCMRTSPDVMKGAPDYAGKVTRGLRPDEVKAARESASYQEAVEPIRAQLAQLDARDAAKACADAARAR